MNKENLEALFDKYIAKFDVLTNSYYDETYKWAACKQFQDNWDINAPNFSNMLKRAMGTLGGGGIGNLADASVQSFSGLVKFAEQEPETVREMFSALFSEGDLKTRIDRFLQDSKPLEQKYGGWRYKQSLSAVMNYLACWKPDEYFFYKRKEANKFAERVEFDGKIERWPKFSPRVYRRMCNELIEAMRQREDLLRVNATRFEKELNGKNRKLWPDESLHILAYDVIYCTFADRYNK